MQHLPLLLFTHITHKHNPYAHNNHTQLDWVRSYLCHVFFCTRNCLFILLKEPSVRRSRHNLNQSKHCWLFFFLPLDLITTKLEQKSNSIEMQHGALRNIRGRRIDEKLHLVECWSAEKQNTAKVNETGRRKTCGCESVPAGRPLCHSASSTISAHLTPIHWALHWLLDMNNAWVVCPHALGPSGNVLVETHLLAVINVSTSSSLLLRSTMQKSWECLLQGQKVFICDSMLKSRTC